MALGKRGDEQQEMWVACSNAFANSAVMGHLHFTS